MFFHTDSTCLTLILTFPDDSVPINSNTQFIRDTEQSSFRRKRNILSPMKDVHVGAVPLRRKPQVMSRGATAE